MNTSKLAWHDLQLILLRAPRVVLTQLKENPGKVFLAGGAIRSIISGDNISDFDLFVPSKEAAIELANKMVKDKDRAVNEKGLLPGAYETDNAFTLVQYKPSIQIIHRWTFDDPCKCIESFDFTIAQAAIWWEGADAEHGKWQSCVSDSYYPDLAAKRLIYTAPVRNEEAGGSLLRVLKFYQKGYRIPLDSFAAVISRMLSGVSADNTAFWLGKQAGGDDLIDETPEHYRARILGGMLREVDPNVDPQHIAHLPSEQTETEEPKVEQV